MTPPVLPRCARGSALVGAVLGACLVASLAGCAAGSGGVPEPEPDADPEPEPEATDGGGAHDAGPPDAGPVDAGPMGPVLYVADVHPIFQAAGCRTCHAPNGPAASTGLWFTEPAEDVYADLLGNGLVDFATPEESVILVNPLLGPAVGHPYNGYASVDDVRYQTVLQWILDGAWLDAVSGPWPLQGGADGGA